MNRTFAVIALLLAGCSTFLPPMPKTGVAATGAPLMIREDLIRETEHYKEKVATVRDEEGHTVADVYEEGTRVHEIPVWFGYQGHEYVDAEDFFHIANDAKSEADVHRARRFAYLANRGGWIATAAGIGLIVLSSVIPQDTPGRSAVFITGLCGFGIGAPIAVWGMTHLSPERHGVPSTSAAMDAEMYNQQLRGGAGASVEHAGPRVGMRWAF